MGEPAFQKNCKGLDVTGKISYWNGHLCGAPIGLKFFLGRFLGRGASLQNFARFARAVYEMLQNRGRVVGASCTFVGHLARFGTVGGDLF